jgi:hypothetical protein
MNEGLKKLAFGDSEFLVNTPESGFQKFEKRTGPGLQDESVIKFNGNDFQNLYLIYATREFY